MIEGNKVRAEVSIGGLDHSENHIRDVVLFQAMRNLLEGSAKVRVSGAGAGTRTTRMRSVARWVDAKFEDHGHSRVGCSGSRSRL